MKKLLWFLLVLGCIACAKKEAPVVEEAPAQDTEAMSDTTMADTTMANDAMAE